MHAILFSIIMVGLIFGAGVIGLRMALDRYLPNREN